MSQNWREITQKNPHSNVKNKNAFEQLKKTNAFSILKETRATTNIYKSEIRFI